MPAVTDGHSVLLTGGSGVVGSAVLGRLLADGLRVRALVRRPEAAAAVAALGAEPYLGDLMDAAVLDEAAAGCRWVFHVAGLNDYCRRDPGALFRVNVEGSLAVLRAAQRAGAERFIHTSSAVTLGEARGTTGHEGARHRGHYLTAYERSKHEAELAVLGESGGVERVVVNPASVQGAGRASGTGRLLLDLARGRLPLAVATRLSLVDLVDVAEGHLAAARHGRPGARYVLSGFSMGLDDVAAAMADHLGSSAPRPPRLLPPGALVLPARLAWWLAPGRLRLCPETVANLRHGAVYDGSLATRELGLKYRRPDETLGDLVAWFRAEGLL